MSATRISKDPETLNASFHNPSATPENPNLCLPCQARKENLERNRARQSQFSSAPDRPALPSSRPGPSLGVPSPLTFRTTSLPWCHASHRLPALPYPTVSRGPGKQEHEDHA